MALRTFIVLVVVNAVIAIATILGVGEGADARWQVLGTSSVVTGASLVVAANAGAFERHRLGPVPVLAVATSCAAAAAIIWGIWDTSLHGDGEPFWKTVGVLATIGLTGTYASIMALPRLRSPWPGAQLLGYASAVGIGSMIVASIIREEPGSEQAYGVLAVLLAAASLVVTVGARVANVDHEAETTGAPDGPPAFTPVVGTLVYLLDRERDQVLMIQRDARPDDDHYGKVNGLGGKVEPDEHILGSLRREVREEAGLELESIRLRGTITWTNFGPRREQWLGFVFLADRWSGDPPTTNHEGTLVWVDRDRLLTACSDDADARAAAGLPMWAGDRHFVPLVFDDDPRVFHGTMPYDGDVPLCWSYERI